MPVEVESEQNVTVTFILKGDLYRQLCDRLSKYGERSMFFRLVTEKFLRGELSVTVPEREL